MEAPAHACGTKCKDDQCQCVTHAMVTKEVYNIEDLGAVVDVETGETCPTDEECKPLASKALLEAKDAPNAGGESSSSQGIEEVEGEPEQEGAIRVPSLKRCAECVFRSLGTDDARGRRPESAY